MNVGPRTLRRLVAAGIVLALAGAFAAGASLFGSHSSTPTVDPTADNGPSLVYGMTKQQIRQITGPPTTVKGTCWYFTPKDGKVGAIPMVNTMPGGPHPGILRLCFVGGLFGSSAEQIPASEVPRSPFPGGKSRSPSSGLVWIAWNQNPFRGACSRRASGCVAK